MSSEDTRMEEELTKEALQADDVSAAEEEIEGSAAKEAPGGSCGAGNESNSGEKNKYAGDDGGKKEEAAKKDGVTRSDEACGTAKDADTEGQSEAAGEKKGFFGRKKEKKDPKDVKLEEFTDRLQRNMAEFDNYRKRTEKEKAAMFEIGAKDVIEKILPVVDNFERGLATIPEEDKGTPFADGMEKIYRQLMKALEDMGVKPIEAVGQPFDPNFHNAVMHIDDESLGENIVAMELLKGYMYRDSVVRHSMVQVAN